MHPWKRAYEVGEVEVCTDGEEELEMNWSWLEEVPPISASDIIIQLFTESVLEKS
jgi:hypothetical protein